MTDRTNQDLQVAAQSVLRDNWVELEDGAGFSKPAARVYPYQWNWDSGFAAIGYAHFDTKRARKELRSLFSGQWANGMLPHIIFHTDSLDYYPDQSFWQTSKHNSNAPEKPQTSGMTQPPIHAIAVWQIYEQMKAEKEPEAEDWLEEMYPYLQKLHKYFYTQRDREQTGLITIYHPWESGMDNSPRWDKALETVTVSDQDRYERKDTNFVDKRFRPSDANYDKYIFLAHKMKEAGYNDKTLHKNHPFAMKDIFLSASLHLATAYLQKIAKQTGKSTDDIESWQNRLPQHIDTHKGEDGLFYDRNMRTDELIKVRTAACLAPIIAGILSQTQVEQLFSTLDEGNFCGEKTCHTSLLPSVSMHEESFSPQLYWRGPIWINVNWLAWRGLKNAGDSEHAKILRHNLLTLLHEHGIWEYYSPLDCTGIGAERFSWSAALAIDILTSE